MFIHVLVCFALFVFVRCMLVAFHLALYILCSFHKINQFSSVQFPQKVTTILVIVTTPKMLGMLTNSSKKNSASGFNADNLLKFLVHRHILGKKLLCQFNKYF